MAIKCRFVDRIPKNQALDPGLEVGTGNWAADTNCAVSRQTTQFRTGLGSLRMRSSASGNMIAVTSENPNPFPFDDAAPGEEWNAIAWWKAGSVGRNARVELNWWTATPTFISNTAGTQVLDATGNWVVATVTGTAPANTADVRMLATVLATGAANEDHFLDDVCFWKTPTARLDLNDGTTWTLLQDGTDFGFPDLRRSVVATMMRDGDEVMASAYTNRIITLSLFIAASSQDACAEQLQTLHRELDRERNILMYQSHNLSQPIFFRTFRQPPTSEIPREGMLGDKHGYYVTVPVLTEPFALGLQTSYPAINVKHDPALTNGRFLDVTGVHGDVATPCVIEVATAFGIKRWTIGVRRHGTPSSMTFVHQCEGMTQGTDTSTQANDAAMSGSSNNFSRTTFATATMTTRLTRDDPGGSNVEGRGSYRVYVRLRKSTAGTAGDITVRAVLEGVAGGGTINGSTVSLPAATGPFLVDLGPIRVPVGIDPVGPGYNPAVSPSNTRLKLQAARNSGTVTLDWDYVILVPADEELLVSDWTTPSAAFGWPVFDGVADALYVTETTSAVRASGKLKSAAAPPWSGSVPMLSPNQTNRLVIVADDSATQDDIGDALDTQVTWWPRFLHIRP